MAVRIGELLLKEKRITPEQLQEALSYQRQNGGKLGANLVKLGFGKDEEITSLLSKQYGVPSISLNHLPVTSLKQSLVSKNKTPNLKTGMASSFDEALSPEAIIDEVNR